MVPARLILLRAAVRLVLCGKTGRSRAGPGTSGSARPGNRLTIHGRITTQRADDVTSCAGNEGNTRAARSGGGRKAEITLDADPGRYAYGLPIFLALLLAAQTVGKSGSRWQRAFAGYLLLLPAQVFSLVMYLLMQMILAAQLNTRALRVDPWQLEAIVYGYQVGVLVLPTLAPILVWLWLDQQFFRSFFMSRWKQS